MKFIGKFFRDYAPYSFLVFLSYGVLFIMRVWEGFYAQEPGSATHILNGFVGDLLVMNVVLLILYFPWKIIAWYNSGIADVVVMVLVAGFFMLLAPVQAWYLQNDELANVAYFNCSLPAAWIHAVTDIHVLSLVFPFVVILVWVLVLYNRVRKSAVSFPPWLGKTLLVIHIVSLPLVVELGLNTGFLNLNHYRVNKPFYFVHSAFGCYAQSRASQEPPLTGTALYQTQWAEAEFPLAEDFPLMRTYQPASCLIPVNDSLPIAAEGTLPNITVIVVEGLAAGFLEPIHGVSFMPFLQQLKGESLDFENFMASSRQRQNALPSIAGGLPYGSDGFTQLTLLPYHFSLFNVLAHNGYHTGYYTGQWTWEMAVDKFLEFNNVDVVVDAGDFPAGYNRVLVGEDNYFWGYNDADLFQLYGRKLKQPAEAPQFTVLQTGSMRPPFALENPPLYTQRFENLLQQVEQEDQKTWLRENQQQLTAMMFTDDVLKDFFASTDHQQGENNTIYIITGNAPMAGLAPENPLGAYHVPLLIHSSLVEQPGIISQPASHHDLYGSVVGMLAAYDGFLPPPFTTSLGNTLCPDQHSPATAIPFMGRDGAVSEILYNGFFLDAEKQLYKVDEGTTPMPRSDEKTRDQLQAMLDAFSSVNDRAVTHLMPDSVFFDYFGFDVLTDTAFAGTRIRDEYRDIIRDLPVDGNSHYIDVRLSHPQVALEEVFIVFELRNEADSVLQWQNFGIPLERDDFRVRIVLEDHLKGTEPGYVNLFLWNESSIPYSFDRIRTTLYRKTR